ncbi:D-alanyl-D-alanine carboxypeptidase [Alsobacter metallidurans]|uniref:D-alanyl-D-alanine carboxypeptidase n=1 Tax=Alsobacter metallidurans TaxID=340221 RepID=A0A917I850_9HYPH|nr:D-alanyl-D-alanine carboxypeptidase [Alsobacter metallidurans]
MGMRQGLFAKRFGAFASIVVTASAIAVIASPAEARRRHHGGGGGYSPPYADMVVDAKTGRTLHAVNEDALRHPASVTKVMTLFLLFEQLEKGRYQLDSELKVSAHAAAQAPSKLGLRPGSTIEVEDAIKALVTKSANDVAATVAENIAGSESEFAEMMTRKARQLGMSRTVYRNASGLPNPGQVTTARDLVTLGRALQDRFPKYYRYFSTPVFAYKGGYHRNHNHLLGRVEGMDGIKTGYTRASGFNLLTSVRTDNRHVVAVVLGGRSAGARDAKMVSLLDDNIDRAYAGVRTAPPATEVAAAVPTPEARREALAARETMAAREAKDARDAKESREIDVAAVKEIVKEAPKVRVASADESIPMTTAALTPARPLARSTDGMRPSADVPVVHLTESTPAPRRMADASAARPVVASAIGASTTTPSSGMRWVVGAAPVTRAEPETKLARLEPRLDVKADARPEPKAETRVEKTAAARPAAGGWIIQLGATDDEDKAKDILARAKAADRALSKASPFTEKVQKAGSTLYRARFSGFDEDDAQTACKQLKRSGFSCFAVKG